MTDGTLVTNYVTYTWDFIVVDPCLTLTFSSPNSGSHTYNIVTPFSSTNNVFGGYSPSACTTAIKLEYKDVGGIWRTFTGAELAFASVSATTTIVIQTSDKSLHGTVQSFRWTLTDTTAVGGAKDYHDEWTYTLVNPCALDEITISAALTPIVYQIGQGNLDIAKAFTQTVSTCPVTKTMLAYDTSLASWVSSPILNAVGSFLGDDKLRINTNDAAYGPQTILTIKLVFQSNESVHATKNIAETITTLTINSSTVCSGGLFTTSGVISD